MIYRPYGHNGFQVSVLGFGASHIGSADCSEADAERILNAVLDEGVTLIDTARGYGSSEERIGRFLSHRRKDFILSTKCGYGIPGVPDWTPECITRGIDEALRLLRTDVIDIMHLHSCPKGTLENDELRGALLRAKEQGKIRVAAYSGENEHRRYALDTHSFTGIQSSLNLCDQRVLHYELPEMLRTGIGYIAKRPIANAFWRFADVPTGDYCEPYWHRARAMGLTPPTGTDWLGYALRFTAFQPGLSSMIIGTKSLDHFRHNIALLEHGPLPQDVLDHTHNLFRRHDNNWVGEV